MKDEDYNCYEVSRGDRWMYKYNELQDRFHLTVFWLVMIIVFLLTMVIANWR